MATEDPGAPPARDDETALAGLEHSAARYGGYGGPGLVTLIRVVMRMEARLAALERPASAPAMHGGLPTYHQVRQQWVDSMASWLEAGRVAAKSSYALIEAELASTASEAPRQHALTLAHLELKIAIARLQADQAQAAVRWCEGVLALLARQPAAPTTSSFTVPEHDWLRGGRCRMSDPVSALHRAYVVARVESQLAESRVRRYQHEHRNGNRHGWWDLTPEINAAQQQAQAAQTAARQAQEHFQAAVRVEMDAVMSGGAAAAPEQAEVEC